MMARSRLRSRYDFILSHLVDFSRSLLTDDDMYVFTNILELN